MTLNITTHYVENHNAKCRVLFKSIFMLNVVMLSVVAPLFVTLSINDVQHK